METIEENAPINYKQTDLRNLLSQFQFRGDNVNKKISLLSGGEKSRVVFLLLFLSTSTLLLLDEPFNHLDIDTCNVLINCLKHFQGSFILCNHNDKFYKKSYLSSVLSSNSSNSKKKINENSSSSEDFITSVLQINEGKLIKYNCNYEEFLKKKD